MNDAEVSAVSHRLAEHLTQNRGNIVAAWVEAVCRDPRIGATDRISRPALVNHVPELIDGLVRSLRAGTQEGVVGSAKEEARDHGIRRLQQGFDLDEMLWEFTRLRVVLMGSITTFEATAGAVVPLEARKVLEAKAQTFIDDLIANAARQYVEEQQFELKRIGSSRLELMRTVSHELRNMLHSFGLAAQSMEEGGDNDIVYLRGLLERNTQHMKELLDDLLQLSTLVGSKATPRVSEFDPAEMLSEVRATFAPMAEAKGLKLSAGLDVNLSSVRGDVLKLKQIVTNLVSNAVKYTESGEVSILFAAVDERTWSIAVADTGVGIDPGEQEQIFAELYRAEKTAQLPGIGIGLSIVNRLVEICQGSIRVESEAGKGSRFEVVLPREMEEGG